MSAGSTPQSTTPSQAGGLTPYPATPSQPGLGRPSSHSQPRRRRRSTIKY